jgi:EmrB/QacA subfamily drug resistance transporter
MPPSTDTLPTTTGQRLRLALLVIATAQLMLVLDDSIANIALPSIQEDLGASASALTWVITAYVLAFGGLLLFGGRAGDVFGRRRVFQLGVGLFTVASLLNGLAPNETVLLASRALQGIGAALAAPNALALIATNFPSGEPRNKAMAAYGAMSGLGITGGVLLGGLLTGIDWRWIFLINIPIGIAVLAGSRNLVEGERHTGRLGALGAVTGTAAILALAYGITRGGEHGWTNGFTIGALFAAIGLLSWFVVLQKRSADPVLPLRLLRDRNRSGSYAAMLFIGAGLMGTAFLLALYLQQVLHFSPVKTGFAFLPFSAGIILSQGVSPKLVEKLAPRLVAAPGLLLAAAAMYWLSLLGGASSYLVHVMPAVFLTAFGLGLAFVPLTLSIVRGVPDSETGVASALFNASQQIGAALGVAVFGSIASAAADTKLPGAQERLADGLTSNDGDLVVQASQALTHGYTTALLVGAGMLVVAAIITSIAVNAPSPRSAEAGEAGVALPSDGAGETDVEAQRREREMVRPGNGEPSEVHDPPELDSGRLGCLSIAGVAYPGPRAGAWN